MESSSQLLRFTGVLAVSVASSSVQQRLERALHPTHLAHARAVPNLTHPLQNALHSIKQGLLVASRQHRSARGCRQRTPRPPGPCAAMAERRALLAVMRERHEQVRRLQVHNYVLRVRRGLFVLHLHILEEMVAHRLKFGAAGAAELLQQVEALRRDAGCAGVADEQRALAVFEPLRDYLEWLQPDVSMLRLER